mmetsp:Transcript_7301/g.16150  ORF Transcript_7301/g.16150 Transcript_7301/m.16150 type:complete len:242 (-) Transcript_7301:160-885(-)
MLHSPLLLPRNQILPSMITLLNDLQSIMLIHELLIQSKYIGWLSIGYFVCTEPFANSGESTRKVLLDVVHVVEEGCPLVFGIDSNNLPISFAFINHAEDTENFDGTDFSCFDNPCANLTDVNGIIVSPASFGVRVDVGGIFPSTWKTSVVEKDISFLELTQNTLLLVLLDEVANFISGNLELFSRELWNLTNKVQIRRRPISSRINMHKSHIMPEGNGFGRSSLIYGLDTIFGGVFVTVGE